MLFFLFIKEQKINQGFYKKILGSTTEILSIEINVHWDHMTSQMFLISLLKADLFMVISNHT